MWSVDSLNLSCVFVENIGYDSCTTHAPYVLSVDLACSTRGQRETCDDIVNLLHFIYYEIDYRNYSYTIGGFSLIPSVLTSAPISGIEANITFFDLTRYDFLSSIVSFLDIN